MARESEFLALDDAALRAVVGPHSRHIALIEDAFCWSRPVREFCCPCSIVTGTICPMR